MLSPRLTLSLLLGMSYLPAIAQTPAPTPTPNKLPAPSAKDDLADAEIIILAGLPSLKEKPEIVSYARKTYVKADLIKDPIILQYVRLALSKIEDQPEKAQEIRQEHLNLLAEYFTKQAMEAQEQNKNADALRLAQIAVRFSPGNAKSKLFYANFLHSFMGRTDDAIQTLRHGMEFLPIDDALTKDYLDRYFQLLQSRERDAEVIDQSLKILREGKNLPPSLRESLALSAATSLYWVGKYPDAVNLVSTYKLDTKPNGLLLKARSLFEGGKTLESISLLENKTSAFKGTARDAVLSQLVRFHLLLGQPKAALSVTQERIGADEKAPFPRIQKLQLLDRLGLKDEFDKELRLVVANFANSSSAMIALANFAAEKGYTNLTLGLANSAAAHSLERSTFAALHLEALLNAGEASQVLAQHREITAADRTFFKSNEPIVQALLGIAYHARPKANEAATKADRSIGDRYLTEFLKAKDLGPEAYRSVSRHLRTIRASDAAVRILEAGVTTHPRHSQLRADFIAARISAGQTTAYGTRKSVADELELLLTLRRPSPLIWQDATAWLRSESNMPADRLRRLEESMTPLMRSNLDQEALAGR